MCEDADKKGFYSVGVYQHRTKKLIIMRPTVWIPSGIKIQLNVEFRLENEEITYENIGAMLAECMKRSIEGTYTPEEREVPSKGLFSTNGQITKNLKSVSVTFFPGEHYKCTPFKAEGRKGYIGFNNDDLYEYVPIPCANHQLGEAILKTFTLCT